VEQPKLRSPTVAGGRAKRRYRHDIFGVRFPHNATAAPGKGGCYRFSQFSLAHEKDKQVLSPYAPNEPEKQRGVHAELTGRDSASALGITVRGSTPVLALCRKLVENGCPPATPLAAYRGGTLCLIVRSIGEAACLEVRPSSTGTPGFYRRYAMRRAALVRGKSDRVAPPEPTVAAFQPEKHRACLMAHLEVKP
jgi:hypothetical protein